MKHKFANRCEIHPSQHGQKRLNPGSHLRKTPLALAVAAAISFSALTLAAPGDPVGGEFRVNTLRTSSGSSPKVAVDADGDFVVTWGSLDGSSYGIYAQRYNAAGMPQGSEFRVNSFQIRNQRFPAVAMDADGDFVVAWESDGQDGDSYGIYARRYKATGVPQGSEFRVNTTTTLSQRFPTVALDADGDFVVTWESLDGSSYGIYAQRYNAAGIPQGNEFRVNTFTTNAQRFPTVALDADGDFIVVWNSRDQDGSGYGIYAQRYNVAGVSQGSEFQVNTFTTNAQRFPAIALDADGDFVVAWISNGQDGSRYGIYAQRYNAVGVPQGEEFRVNSFTPRDQLFPTVALDADGDFVVAWSSDRDGNSLDIYAQRYNVIGVPQGGQFQVNTFTTHNQRYPAAALDADGDFVVAWNSYQDGSGFGIYAQRFEGPRKFFCNDVSASFVGTIGDDILTGTAGNDVIHALVGNDTLNGLGGNDILCGGPGNDILNGGDGTDALRGDEGDDILNGDPGVDNAIFEGTAGITANLTTNTASGEGSDTLSGIENLTGSLGNDTLVGNADPNVLNGRLGNDSLNGAGGSDTAAFYGMIPVTANLTTGTATGLGSDTLLNIENLTGSSANDSLTGNGGNNRLQGGLGDDSLDGVGGIDLALFPGSTAVNANLTTGSATGQGNDTLIGSSGADNLDGGANTDTCDGGANRPSALDSASNCETVLNVP